MNQSGMNIALREYDPARRLFPHDTLGRPLRDLRLSVIEACNFRCPYCMPAGQVADGHGWTPLRDSRSMKSNLVRVSSAWASTSCA